MGRLIPFRFSANRNGQSHTIQEDPPLRAELFSVEQLQQHAVTFAQSHELARAKVRAPGKLLSRLDENDRVLCQTYDLVTAAVGKDRRIAPAAEWLLDNFYLIEEQ